MGLVRHVLVLLSLHGALWLPYGTTREKDGMRQQLRLHGAQDPFDGGAVNIATVVDSASVTRPSPMGTSTLHMHRRAMDGCRMLDVSHVKGWASCPGIRESGWPLYGSRAKETSCRPNERWRPRTALYPCPAQARGG